MPSKEKEIAYSFHITAEQEDKALAWQKKHLDEKHEGPNTNDGAVGGRWSWVFVPTSIDTFLTIRCVCGDECNLTEYYTIEDLKKKKNAK